ncbi:MAG: DUF2244 domain-containing protein [Bacteroidota bacterium]|jgi:uncharacterized membrane protein
MNEKGVESQDPNAFSAVLMPHRSLGRTGFLVLMGVLCFVSFTTGLVFYMMGAWPVLGFFGLDVLLVYIAFRLSYRDGRIYERVDLNRSLLTVLRVHPSGREERFTFNPYWVQVRLEKARNGRTDLRLRLHGQELSFGRFLTDQERQDLAEALTGALVDTRGGVRI